MAAFASWKRYQRKLLGSTIFGAVSSLFFVCYFGWMNWSDAPSYNPFIFALVVVPSAITAFLLTPGGLEYTETFSWGDALFLGTYVTSLSYLASFATVVLPITLTSLNNTLASPASFLSVVGSTVIAVVFGAFYVLLPALPFGLLGGLLYRFLAKRALNTG